MSSTSTISLAPMPSETGPLLATHPNNPSTTNFQDPEETTINIPPEPADEPPICCESLAGKCQKLEDCLLILGNLASITGLIYSIYTNDQAWIAVSGFSTISQTTALIWNKTCGNLPRIHRQFMQATKKLDWLVQKKWPTVEKQYQTQIEAFKVVTNNARKVTDDLKLLQQQSEETRKGLQVNLDSITQKATGLESTNKELKKSLDEETLLNSTMKKQIEELSTKVSSFNENIQKASQTDRDLKLVEDQLGSASSAMESERKSIQKGFEEEMATNKQNTESYQKLLEESNILRKELEIVQSSLNDEKQNNGALIHENSLMRQQLDAMSDQFKNLQETMRQEVDELKNQNQNLLKENEQWEKLQKLVEDNRKRSEETKQLEQKILSEQTKLNLQIQNDNSELLKQLNLLQGKKK